MLILNGVQGVGGSNPLVPTNKIKGLREIRNPFFFGGVHEVCKLNENAWTKNRRQDLPGGLGSPGPDRVGPSCWGDPRVEPLAMYRAHESTS